MKRFLGSVLTLIMIITLAGCSAKKVEEKEKENGDITFSENILLSLNHGAPGYGTITDCIDAEIFIYKDKTVKMVVYYPEELEIASFELSDSDYGAICELADPEDISSLNVKSDMEVCDGSSYHITLYDENDEELLSKGGYMPIGKKFWKIYDGIKEVLEPYGIRDAMVSYRQSVENGNNPVAVPDADETEMISLLQGEWICESGSAYIEMYQQDNTFYMDLVHDWHVYSEVRDCYFSPVLELEYRDDWDTELPTEDFSENEVVIDIVRRDGELSYDGVFIADKNGEYLKYQMLEEEDTWYYFYPFKEDVPVEIYIYTNSLVQSIKETVKSEDVQEDSLREAAELLVSRNVISLYPNQCSVTVMDEEVLKIEALCQCMEKQDGAYWVKDYNIVFYLDATGAPVFEIGWEKTQS